MEGRKYDHGKPMMSLLPPWAMEEIAKVLTLGAQKYEIDNWKRVEDGKQRYMDAMLRHINAFQRGEINDPEFGTHHLAHAACCLLFILDADVSGIPLAPKEPTKKDANPIKEAMEPYTGISDFINVGKYATTPTNADSNVSVTYNPQTELFHFWR